MQAVEEIKINEMALLERAKAIQSLFASAALPVRLVEKQNSKTDYHTLFITLDYVKMLVSAGRYVEALRVFRRTVAHEQGHVYITQPDLEKWAAWYIKDKSSPVISQANIDPLKHLIHNLIEDRRVNYAVAKRYPAYALARKTFEAFLFSQVYIADSSEQAAPSSAIVNKEKVLFSNALIAAMLFSKVPEHLWKKLTPGAQKVLLLVVDIMNGKPRAGMGRESKALRDQAVDWIYNIDVLIIRAERIHKLVLPLLKEPEQAIIKQEQEQGQGESGEGGEGQQGQSGEQGSEQGEQGEGQGESGDDSHMGVEANNKGIGGEDSGSEGKDDSGNSGTESHMGESGAGEPSAEPSAGSNGADDGDDQESGATDLRNIDRDDYAGVELPVSRKVELPGWDHDSQHSRKEGGEPSVPRDDGEPVLKPDFDPEAFARALQQLAAQVEATASEEKDIKIIFGIDLSKEKMASMAALRAQALGELFGEHRIIVPEPDLQKYEQFRDAEVNGEIAKLSRMVLEETRLKRKSLTTESGGLLNANFISQYLARDREFFVEKRRSHRSVAWGVLIDVSGSVSEAEVIRAFIILSEIGKQVCGEDKLLLATFDSQYYLVKDFSERVDQLINGRIGNSYAGGSTNICCSIEKTAYRLSRILAERRVLIIISDGDQNTCEREGKKRAKPENHLIEAVETAKRLGVIPIHIKIGRYGCVDIPGCVVMPLQDIAQFAEVFLGLYRKIAQVKRR